MTERDKNELDDTEGNMPPLRRGAEVKDKTPEADDTEGEGRFHPAPAKDADDTEGSGGKRP